jgi:carbon-monoxide dehydrogenase medium subunit
VAPPPFAYHRPLDLDEALGLIAVGESAALAGGTDLVSLRAGGQLAPRHVVDIKAIDALGVHTTARGGPIALGPTTSCASIARLGGLGVDAIVDGAAIVGAPQTRERATLGGNICRSSPAGDMLCGLLVLDATLELRSVRGERTLPASAFFVGPGRNQRAEDELLTKVTIESPRGASAYARFTYRRAMDLAVAGVGVWVEARDGECTAARVAIGAVASTPLLVPEAADALVGRPLRETSYDDAIEALVRAANPIDDVRGTRGHRLRVLRPLARSVFATAFARVDRDDGEQRGRR